MGYILSSFEKRVSAFVSSVVAVHASVDTSVMFSSPLRPAYAHAGAPIAAAVQVAPESLAARAVCVAPAAPRSPRASSLVSPGVSGPRDPGRRMSYAGMGLKGLTCLLEEGLGTCAVR